MEKLTTSPGLRKFVNDREEWTDRQIELSKLYYLSLLENKMERTRSNTSMIVWWMIVIPIIFAILFFFTGIAALTQKRMNVELALGIALSNLFFLLIRAVVIQYYKIDRRIELLEKSNRLLREIIDKL